MKKKASYLVAFILFASIIPIYSLFIFTQKSIFKKNGFVRVSNGKSLSPIRYITLPYNSYYLSGLTNNHAYLSNFTNPSNLIITNYSFEDTQHLSINISPKYKIAWKATNVIVDSPDLYITEMITPSILSGNVDTLITKDYFTFDKHDYLEAMPIAKNLFVLRVYDTAEKQAILEIKYFYPGLTYKAKRKKVLEKQIDGKFCTDGMLLYTPQLGYLVYLYYYRNQFICLDSNLNIIYKGNTIDTISRAQIKVDSVYSEQIVTFSKPALMVNRKSCVFNDKLYVNSDLIADNEDKKLFQNNDIIDIYDLNNGKYKYTFYLPRYKGKRIRDFKVLNNKLLAIYDEHLLLYKIF